MLTERLAVAMRESRDRNYRLNYGERTITEFCGLIARERANVGTIVDLGAGEGRDLALAGEALPVARRVGIDFGDATVSADVGIERLALDLEREPLPFPDAAIDILIANQVYEHLKDIFWVSHEACRVLAVGGHLIVGMPNLAALHNRLLLLLGLQPTCVKSCGAHIRGFTKPDVLSFFALFPGLELVAFRGQNLYPFPPPISRFVTRLAPGIAVSNFYLFRKAREYRGEFLEYLERTPLETNFFRGKPRGAAE